MALIVEDGTGLPDANSYATVEYANAYFSVRGVEQWEDADTSEKEAALVRATSGLDTKYRGKWIGQKRHAEQKLAWPRSQAIGEDDPLTDEDGAPLPTDAVPALVMEAVCEVALIELSERFVQTTVDRAGMVKRKKTDVLETEWFEGAANLAYSKPFPHIDQMLSGLASASGTSTIHFDMLLTERERRQGSDYDPFDDPHYFNKG